MEEVIVIGAGPAGLLAAWVARQRGAKVRVLASGIGTTHISPGWIQVLNESPGASLEQLDRRAPGAPLRAGRHGRLGRRAGGAPGGLRAGRAELREWRRPDRFEPVRSGGQLPAADGAGRGRPGRRRARKLRGRRPAPARRHADRRASRLARLLSQAVRRQPGPPGLPRAGSDLRSARAAHQQVRRDAGRTGAAVRPGGRA